jgi:hypothetical protein
VPTPGRPHARPVLMCPHRRCVGGLPSHPVQMHPLDLGAKIPNTNRVRVKKY